MLRPCTQHTHLSTTHRQFRIRHRLIYGLSHSARATRGGMHQTSARTVPASARRRSCPNSSASPAGAMVNRGIAQRTMGDVSYSRSRSVGGVGDCPCIVPTLGYLGETSGPRIDRIQPARPPWWRRQYRELKKLIFSAPSKCPIDIFGPLANRRMLERLHARSEFASVLHAASKLWLPRRL